VPGFAVERFERQAEAFVRARGWHQWQHLAGLRAGLSLSSLYTEDFPDFTSIELFADLQGAQIEDPGQQRSLVGLLAGAFLEGRSVGAAERAAAFAARATLDLGDEHLLWRAAPPRWATVPETPLRHGLQEAWRDELRGRAGAPLERWQTELLELMAVRLAAGDWVDFWDNHRGLGLATLGPLADGLLATTADVYGHVLGVYLGQLELPIDDVWQSDVDWAFRASQFDSYFPGRRLMPLVAGTLRDLGIDLTDQPSVRLDVDARASLADGVHCVAVGVPEEIHVLVRRVGGYQDYGQTLRGVGMAQHLAQTDRSLPFATRWLGDRAPTLGYGLLLERLTLDPVWLRDRLEFTAIEDYRVVAHLAWLARVRAAAARLQFEARFWRSGAESGGMGADWADAMSGALRLHAFSGEHLALLLGSPWSTLDSATWLRAELFAAQLAAYLRREFDAEWWRDPRAARLLVQELWRPGRRYTAEELLRFMGYDGFDAAVLGAELGEVLAAV